MAGAKKYVEVAAMSVKSGIDGKFKPSALNKAMSAAAAKAVNRSSKLTTKQAAGGDEDGFYVDGTLTSLTLSGEGKSATLKAECKMLLATWPAKSMFAFPSGSAEFEVDADGKLDKDAAELVAGLVESLMGDKGVKELERRAK
jgi:hypothetical protein